MNHMGSVEQRCLPGLHQAPALEHPWTCDWTPLRNESLQASKWEERSWVKRAEKGEAWLVLQPSSHCFRLSGFQGFADGSVTKESTCNAGDTGDVGLIPGPGRSSGEGSDNPLQYSYLGNPMDRGAWATVHRVAELDAAEGLTHSTPRGTDSLLGGCVLPRGWEEASQMYSGEPETAVLPLSPRNRGTGLTTSLSFTFLHASWWYS